MKSHSDTPIWMFPKIGGKKPKMDGENNGKPYVQMDDLGGFPIFLETPIWSKKNHPKDSHFAPENGVLLEVGSVFLC